MVRKYKEVSESIIPLSRRCRLAAAMGGVGGVRSAHLTPCAAPCAGTICCLDIESSSPAYRCVSHASRYNEIQETPVLMQHSTTRDNSEV